MEKRNDMKNQPCQSFIADQMNTLPASCIQTFTKIYRVSFLIAIGVRLMKTSGERVTRTPQPSANKAAHSGFETGINGPTKRTYVLQKLNKINLSYPLR